jgi:hypothetical protein
MAPADRESQEKLHIELVRRFAKIGSCVRQYREPLAQFSGGFDDHVPLEDATIGRPV